MAFLGSDVAVKGFSSDSRGVKYNLSFNYVTTSTLNRTRLEMGLSTWQFVSHKSHSLERHVTNLLVTKRAVRRISQEVVNLSHKRASCYIVYLKPAVLYAKNIKTLKWDNIAVHSTNPSSCEKP